MPGSVKYWYVFCGTERRFSADTSSITAMTHELHEKWLWGLPSSEDLTTLHDVLQRPTYANLSRVDFNCVGKLEAFISDGLNLEEAKAELDVRLRTIFAPWATRSIFYVTHISDCWMLGVRSKGFQRLSPNT